MLASPTLNRVYEVAANVHSRTHYCTYSPPVDHTLGSVPACTVCAHVHLYPMTQSLMLLYSLFCYSHLEFWRHTHQQLERPSPSSPLVQNGCPKCHSTHNSHDSPLNFELTLRLAAMFLSNQLIIKFEISIVSTQHLRTPVTQCKALLLTMPYKVRLKFIGDSWVKCHLWQPFCKSLYSHILQCLKMAACDNNKALHVHLCTSDCAVFVHEHDCNGLFNPLWPVWPQCQLVTTSCTGGHLCLVRASLCKPLERHISSTFGHSDMRTHTHNAHYAPTLTTHPHPPTQGSVNALATSCGTYILKRISLLLLLWNAG